MVREAALYRVLIVDDAPSVREALRWLLDEIPYLTVVGEAEDGVTAVNAATTLTPDLVILDINLPGQDGYHVARSLKQLDSPPLVIFLTAHGSSSNRQRAHAAGDGYVEKEAGWPALLAQINQLLGG
jgi:two-component system response regulator AlgR